MGENGGGGEIGIKLHSKMPSDPYLDAKVAAVPLQAIGPINQHSLPPCLEPANHPTPTTPITTFAAQPNKFPAKDTASRGTPNISDTKCPGGPDINLQVQDSADETEAGQEWSVGDNSAA